MLFRGRVARTGFFSSTATGTAAAARERVRVAGALVCNRAVEPRSARVTGGGGCGCGWGVMSRASPLGLDWLSGAGEREPDENMLWLRFSDTAGLGSMSIAVPLGASAAFSAAVMGAAMVSALVVVAVTLFSAATAGPPSLGPAEGAE